MILRPLTDFLLPPQCLIGCHQDCSSASVSHWHLLPCSQCPSLWHPNAHQLQQCRQPPARTPRSQTGPADAKSGTEEACIRLAFLKVKNLVLPTVGLPSTYLLTHCFMLLLAMDRASRLPMLAKLQWQTGRFHSALPSPDHQLQLKPVPAPIFGAHYWSFSILQCDLVLPSLEDTRESLLHSPPSFFTQLLGRKLARSFLKIQT